jgi:hypothetical protein
MPMLVYLAAMRVNGDLARSISSTSAEIVVIALFGIMFGLIVLVFVGAGSKRSHRH